MSLRWKLSLVIAGISAAIIGAVYSASEWTFNKSFQSIEDRNTRQMAERATHNIFDNIQDLNVLNRDWAAWDDTYNFVQHPDENPNYIESNPTDTTFANARLNFILIINNAGQLVYGKSFDLNSNKTVPILQSLEAHIFGETLARHATVTDSKSGIILLPEGPLMISSQPIVTSQGEGPVAGTIIMARFLDQAEIELVSETVQLPLSLVTVDDAKILSDFQKASTSLTTDANTLALPINAQSIAAYSLISDIYGKPILILRTVLPRDIYAQSLTAMRVFLLSLLGFVILFGAVLNYFLGKAVISKVSNVSHYVSAIRKSGDLSKRLLPEGNDELATLNRGINSMVESLQDSQLSLEAQKKAEEKLRLTIESVAEGIATTDLAGNIMDANDSKILLHGYSSKADIIGIDSLNLIAEEDRDSARTALQTTLETGLSGTAEYTMLKADGSRFFGESSAALLKSPDARPIGFVISTKDVTERKQVETAFRAQKELIDRILATIPNAVLVIDACDRIVLANRTFSEKFGLRQKIAEGMLLNEAVPIKDLADAILEARQKDLTKSHLEFRHPVSDNKKIFIASILQMQKNETLLMFTDVTEERARQERQFHTDRLASVGQMAAGIAHELNNPLTGVVVLSQMLLDSEEPDSIKKDLESINQEALRAATVVKNMLTFARTHAPSRQTIQINGVIEDVLKLRAYEHKMSNIQIQLQLDGNLPEIRVDSFQMQQVFLNLILNAEHSMIESPNSRTLTVATGSADDMVRVSLSDSGLGIAPKNMSKLFSPFFTTKEVGKGTGLGLSICYGIVKNHGGNIYARSELGHGATFVVELPVTTPDEGGAPEPA